MMRDQTRAVLGINQAKSALKSGRRYPQGVPATTPTKCKADVPILFIREV
jgi:hypothetical protein